MRKEKQPENENLFLRVKELTDQVDLCAQSQHEVLDQPMLTYFSLMHMLNVNAKCGIMVAVSMAFIAQT